MSAWNLLNGTIQYPMGKKSKSGGCGAQRRALVKTLNQIEDRYKAHREKRNSILNKKLRRRGKVNV